MSTSSVFMAGVTLASQILNKRGHIEVDYENRHMNPYEKAKHYQLINMCEERGIESRNWYDGEQSCKKTLIDSLMSYDLVNPQPRSDIGPFGRLYIGTEQSTITLNDIEVFISCLEKNDYIRHYALIGATYNDEIDKIELEWAPIIGDEVQLNFNS